MARSSEGAYRIIFTAAQKSKLEALFRRKKYPTKKERSALGAKLDVPLDKVTVCPAVILLNFELSIYKLCKTVSVYVERIDYFMEQDNFNLERNDRQPVIAARGFASLKLALFKFALAFRELDSG